MCGFPCRRLSPLRGWRCLPVGGLGRGAVGHASPGLASRCLVRAAAQLWSLMHGWLPRPPRPHRCRKELTQPPHVPSGEGRLARLAPHGGLNGALGAPAASTLLIASSPKQCKQADHAEHRSPLGSGVSNKLGRGAQVTGPQWDPRCWGSVRPLGTAPHSVSRLVQGERSSSR